MLLRSESIKELAAALAIAQKEFQTIEKNQEVEVKKDGRLLYRFKYADLTEIINKTRPALSKNGLSFTQSYNGSGFITCLMHSSGEFVETGFIPCFIHQNAHMKEIAGYSTYGKRLSLSEALGVSADDDMDAPPGEGEHVEKPKVKTSIKNEAPCTQNHIKYIFTVANQKNISEESLREILKGLYNITSTKDLKVWQQAEMINLMLTKSLDEIGHIIIDRQNL